MRSVKKPNEGDKVKVLVGVDQREFVGIVQQQLSAQFSVENEAGERHLVLYVQGYELLEPGPKTLYPEDRRFK
jgi:hypothetical protein